jgi:hypothetical protein
MGEITQLSPILHHKMTNQMSDTDPVNHPRDKEDNSVIYTYVLRMYKLSLSSNKGHKTRNTFFWIKNSFKSHLW